MTGTPLGPSTGFAVVVDDDPARLGTLCELLREAGLEPLGFASAEAALVDVSTRAVAGDGHPGALPALVVTNLYVPGIDGWRFCRLLRSPEYAPFNDVPILVLAAAFEGDEADNIARHYGASVLPSAHVDPGTFIEQVRASLAGRRPSYRPQVLIADADAAQATALAEAFRAHGYLADIALTTREATDALLATAYDAAVLDHHLPDDAGDSLLDTCRTARPQCTCIVVAAEVEPGLAVDWLRRGAAAYSRHPIRPDALIELCTQARRERGFVGAHRLLQVRTHELRESEERHRIVLEHSPDPIFSFTREGRYTYVNRAFAEGVRKPVEDIIGKTIWDVFPKEEADMRFASLSQVFRTGEEKVIQVRVPLPDGDRYYVTTITPIKDATGEVRSAICSSKEVTESKRAEEAVRQAHRRLDEIIEFLPDATFVINAAGEVIVWSRAMEQMTGVAKEDMIGKGNHEYSLPFYGVRRPLLIDLALLPDEEFEQNHYEGVTRHADGLVAEAYTPQVYGGKGGSLWGAASRLRDDDGNIVGAIESIRDVTVRKHAEEALRESERRLRSIFDDMSLVALMLDLDGRITYCNDFLLHTTGWTREALLGQYWCDCFLPPDTRGGATNEVFGETIASGRVPIHTEGEIVTRLGEHRTVSWNNTYLRGLDGLPVGLASVGEDITERRRAEEDRERLQAQLTQAQKMESVGRLAGGVAHDFNNMLVAILGHVEMAIERVDRVDPLHADLEEIRNAAERSADLTRQLLAFARKQTIAPKVVDLNDTVASALKMLHRLIGENILLTWRPGPDLWSVNVDPSQIDQIMANLCVNARDAVANVGEICIETGNRTLDAAYCATHDGLVPGQYVCLVVSDNGRGMDEETLGHVFEPFYTTKGIGEGTGLGLATVYGAVRQNNGFIDVHSEQGRGTIFTIYLPRHEGTATRPPAPAAPAPAARGHETILLVEDEPAILRLATKMLERQGYTVLAAPTPREAIRLAEEHAGEVHLLVTDVVMPEMNGRDLAKGLLSLYPHLKRLFMSGYTADVIAHHGVLDEGLSFIQKPFSRKVLADKVREVLDSDSGC